MNYKFLKLLTITTLIFGSSASANFFNTLGNWLGITHEENSIAGIATHGVGTTPKDDERELGAANTGEIGVLADAAAE